MTQTEKKQPRHYIEQRHQLLAEYAKDVIWTMGGDGSITYVSPAVFKLRGLTPEEAIQQSIDQILTPPSQATVGQYFVDVLTAIQTGQVPKDFKGDLEYYRADGSMFWTEVLAFPILDSDGKLVEILGVTRDISERKLYEDQLNAARELAEKANSAKSEFVAHISHEVRTPMTAMMTYLEYALQTSDPEELKVVLQRARSAGDLMLHLINDILDFSKIESGKMHLQKQAFSLQDVVDQVTHLVEQGVKAKELKYVVDMECVSTKHLVGDGPRLTQALLNLVSNAVKFTDDGAVHIRVEQIGELNGDVHLKFLVTDTGPGLSREMCEKVFDRFVQGTQPKQTKNSGTGLGLSICKQLAELMGGEAGVSSSLGSGSTFWFTAIFARDKCQVLEKLQSNNEDVSASMGGIKLLLIDDDEFILDSMKRALVRLGMQVDCANGGHQGYEMAIANQYDLLLVDVQMQGMGGLELTQKLRQTKQGIKIVGVSANGLGDDRTYCLAAGMDDHISKPFVFSTLLDAIGRHTFSTGR